MKVPLFVIVLLLMLIGGRTALAQEPLFDAIAEQKGRDDTFPSIIKVSITPASTAVRIEWETDKPSQSFLEYGETPAYGLRAPATGETAEVSQSHRVELTGLSEFRTYHFRVRSTYPDRVNEAFSRALTFTTLPSGSFAESPLVPTPLDFTAPHVQSFLLDQKEGAPAIDIVTDEQSVLRIEYGVYVKGSPFLFEDKESTPVRVERVHFALRSLTPGSVYGYRLTTQDRLGNRAFLYGTFQTSSVVPPQKQPSAPHASPADVRPQNSVLITQPSQLAGIPKADIWKDAKSRRLYRIFRTAPFGSVLLTHPSELAGLTVFQVWRDEKTGRLYRHAGIPNPEHNATDKSNAIQKSNANDKNKEKRPLNVPKNWIRITHPLQLRVLFPHEVWRDAKSGMMYRIVGAQQKASQPAQPKKQVPSLPSQNKKEDSYIPFYQ